MKRESESVSFIGLGYVGLCTAAVLASRGMKIIGVDIDGEKIAKLAKGETPLHEPGLGSMLKSAVKNRRIQFTTDIDRVVEADVTFITVGTPSNQDGSISLTFVKKAAEDVGSAIRGADAYHLVVVRALSFRARRLASFDQCWNLLAGDPAARNWAYVQIRNF